MSNLTISAKVRNSIFKILGTKQFELEIGTDRYGEIEINLYCPKNQDRGNYVEYFNLYDTNWEQELLTEMYQGKNRLRAKIAENMENLEKEKEENEQLEKLEKKYDEMLKNEVWFFAPDMCFDVKIKEALENDMVWGFKATEENVWGINRPRHSFILEVHGAEIIRYCHVDNCYYSLVNYNFTEKVKAENWYEKGYRVGYDDGYSSMYSDYKQHEIKEKFPSQVAEEVFIDGYHAGSYQGYMDT